MADRPSAGFAGVGNMGWPMASCLAREGFTVHVNEDREIVRATGSDATRKGLIRAIVDISSS
jgi:3-hydroxyisobutyrate dehydrogenase-like beta-hydroxyacid dehydrogenase